MIYSLTQRRKILLKLFFTKLLFLRRKDSSEMNDFVQKNKNFVRDKIIAT